MVWIRNRKPDRNFSKVGTGTATNRYQVQLQTLFKTVRSVAYLVVGIVLGMVPNLSENQNFD
jgi:hypothetical protein